MGPFTLSALDFASCQLSQMWGRECYFLGYSWGYMCSPVSRLNLGRLSRHLSQSLPVSEIECWYLRAHVGFSSKLQANKDLQNLSWPSPPPTHIFPQRKMKESDNYFYLPPNCTNYQPISSQCDRHQLWKTHRDKLALIGFPLAV